MKNLKDENFHKEVSGENKLMMLDFWAPWCSPCSSVAPIVHEIAKKYDGKIEVFKINIDEAPQISSEYKIEAIPCFIFLKGEKVIDRLVGLSSFEDLEKKIDSLLS